MTPALKALQGTGHIFRGAITSASILMARLQSDFVQKLTLCLKTWWDRRELKPVFSRVHFI
jgi:hypothetical protein